MAEKKTVRFDTVYQQYAPKTPELAAFLAAGYGMTIEKAQLIIKERKADPNLWPYEMLEKAEALLAAYEAKPQVISTRKPWQINGRSVE